MSKYDEVTFEIKEHLSVLKTVNDVWTKEVNIVSWNGAPDKIDIRDWDASHERMTRGITLFDYIAEKLAKVLTEYKNSDDKFDFKSFEPKELKDDKVTFDVLKHIGVLEERKDGWTKEVNIVSWNGGMAKFDIRDWDSTHERMTRGITLEEDAAMKLGECLAERYGI